MPEIRIEGLAKLSRELRKTSRDLPREVKKISKDSAEIVAGEARTLAPVRSGRLRAQIRSAATIKGGEVRVRGLRYAPVIHFGWAHHNIEPNPFLYHALDARRAEVLQRFERDITALLNRNFTPGTS